MADFAVVSNSASFVAYLALARAEAAEENAVAVRKRYRAHIDLDWHCSLMAMPLVHSVDMIVVT